MLLSFFQIFTFSTWIYRIPFKQLFMSYDRSFQYCFSVILSFYPLQKSVKIIKLDLKYSEQCNDLIFIKIIFMGLIYYQNKHEVTFVKLVRYFFFQSYWPCSTRNWLLNLFKFKPSYKNIFVYCGHL